MMSRLKACLSTEHGAGARQSWVCGERQRSRNRNVRDRERL